MRDPAEALWRALKSEVSRVDTRINRLQTLTQRSETTGGVAASTLANAPLAADGGMSDGTEYIDLLWISNGRKPGEGAGAGTGVLAYYDSSADAWHNVHDYAAVTV